MEIGRRGNALVLSDLDPFLAELLRQIPESTSTEGDNAAAQRIFSAPTSNHDEQLAAEWKNYVEPELRRLFQDATAVVAEDLQQLEQTKQKVANCTLRIPKKNVDAWLNALNQARLALTAKNEFSDKELGDHFRSPLSSRRDLSLFQVNFYGFVQECILRELMGFGTADD
jgi:hypothetical protein